jgi:hypothetical protein
MNILFYGNCQLAAYNKILNIKNSNINVIECWNTDISELDFTNIVKNTNIIITQSINDNYRDKSYLSTKYILEICKKDCKIIILDNCYFDFYYLDLNYKWFNNKVLAEPISYHYENMINCYKNNECVDYYIENIVNNVNLKTYDELDKLARESINELKLRYEKNMEKYSNTNLTIHFETCYDYIRDHYKNELLFYCMNHPTKCLLQHNCYKIIKIIKQYFTIDYEFNYDIDPFNYIQCIIYKCIQQNVTFDISCFFPSINLENLKITGTKEIVDLYYKTYKTIGFH